MDPDVSEFIERVKRVRRRRIPASADIVAETFTRLGYTHEDFTSEQVRQQFNRMLATVFRETLVTLENYERPAYSRHAVRELTEIRGQDLDTAYSKMQSLGGNREGFSLAVQDLMETWYYHLRQLFLSVSQSRKVRGGRDFELQLEHLFRLAGFPYEAQQRESRIDILLPDYAHYRNDRTQCLIVSAKRTLRERWQQVVDELHKMNCPNVYLATTDASISLQKDGEIAARNIKLVVFDEVKQRKFAQTNTGIGFSHLAGSVIPQWEHFW